MPAKWACRDLSNSNVLNWMITEDECKQSWFTKLGKFIYLFIYFLFIYLFNSAKSALAKANIGKQ